MGQQNIMDAEDKIIRKKDVFSGTKTVIWGFNYVTVVAPCV